MVIKAITVFFAASWVLTSSARADKLVLDNPTSSKDGSAVTIEKGNIPQYTEYEIVDGHDEIFGSPDYDRIRAYDSWKTACNDWKKSMKELNAERELLSLSCNSPTLSKDGTMMTYKSSASYKMRLRMKERK
jgi:hypothetical protein